jgi:UDP-glucose 4-epimerase
MPSVLLTGATGLVGSRLLPRLAEAGVSCRALLRRDMDLPPNTTSVRGDLENPDSLPPALAGVDTVVHFAAFFRTEDEDAVWRANRDGTRNLIDAAEAHTPGVRFIMASTGNVYNADLTRPGREDDDCAPTAAYPASKLVAEQILRESPLNWSILRLPFVYGDGDGHLEQIPKMAPRFGLHPAHTYSVAHHRDIFTAVEIALTGTMDGRIVNICDDRPLSVYEMSEIAGDPIEGSAEPLANPWSGRMDPSLAHQLGFRPTVPTIFEAQQQGLL